MTRVALALAAIAPTALSAPAEAAPVDEATRGFHRQMEAWNSGDLEAALSAYWNSPDLTWVNKRGISNGFAPFAQSMRQEGAKGTYSGEVLHARRLSSKSALLVVRWAIVDQGKRLMGGVSTQLWEVRDGRWKIVLEHAS
jgi:hypothetical protein